EATAALIAHLAVLDERRLYLAEGCSRLFVYCTQVLHFSESAAYRRVEVARAARRYPVILTLLAEGSVNLTTVLLLAAELTPSNHRELLVAATHKSKNQVEELIASLRPKPAVPSSVRMLPVARARSACSPTQELLKPTEVAPTQAEIALPVARPTVVPLAPQRYKVVFTASGETYAKLRQLQDLLRHQIPDGDLGEIMGRAVSLLLKEVIKQKFAVGTRTSEKEDANGNSRHIPARVRRAVWVRDEGQCAFVAQNGRRCSEKAFLEFHHVEPYSAGGKATIDNIELRCRAHNQYEAEVFGTVWTEPEFKTVHKLGL
ncbi:MAG TPA: HNH endonuclease signature motif containing protein, partial [bacterium]